MKPLFVFFACLIYASANSQIGTPVKNAPATIVGKVSNFGTFVGQISYLVNAEKTDTTYDLSFRNYKYTTLTQIDHIYFSGVGGALDSLYALAKTVFLDANKKNKDYGVNVTLGSQLISISAARSMGYPAVMIQTSAGFGLFTEKQLNTLFGKN